MLELLQNAAVAVLVANLITMFINDEKLKKAAPILKVVLAFLNTVSLNVFNNKNL